MMVRMSWHLAWVGMFWLLACAGMAGATEQIYDGIIAPSEIVKVSSQVNGILDEITVERGDTVVSGQVIARLNARIEKAAVDLARARMEFGRRKVARNEELYRKKLISIHEKDEMQTELQISELQLQEALEKLEARIIRSTIDGVVVERFLAPGEYVGESTPIMEIARIRPLYVEVVLPVEMFGRIRKGMKGTVNTDYPKPRSATARVTLVDRVIDAASGTFGVRLELPNTGEDLPAGLKCRVVFNGL